jgi:hypothetical protein
VYCAFPEVPLQECLLFGLRTRYNERTDFLLTITPASNESAPPTNVDLFSPHLVNGGGYTTQFILFSGTVGRIGQPAFLEGVYLHLNNIPVPSIASIANGSFVKWTRVVCQRDHAWAMKTLDAVIWI